MRGRPKPVAPLDPARAVAYLRVSTEEQHLGPAAQRTLIEAWAARSGVAVVRWELDHLTGSADVAERPGLAAALAALSAEGCGVLVVAKRDRLARDSLIALTVERQVERLGARIHSADGVGNGDAPADKLMRSVVNGVAEMERAMIRSRTRDALAELRRQGRRNGKVPFGFRADAAGVLHPDEAERETLARVYELADGGAGDAAIARQLDAEGRRTRAGGPYARKTIWTLRHERAARRAALAGPEVPS